VNPADLFRKHSLSDARLEQLVALHGCKYLDGRASSAPQVREGESTKAMMASLGGGLIATTADIVDTVASERIAARGESMTSAVETPQVRPTMPHLELFGQALDKAYPPMTVPDGEIMQDMNLDENDATFQTGLREAVAIANEARNQGRKRKMSPITQTSNAIAKEAEDAVKLLVEQEEATFHSTLGRRRSTRKVLVPELLEPPSKPFAGSVQTSEELKIKTPREAAPSSLSCAYSTSQFPSCACVARCLDQVKFASSDRLAYTHSIF
jgi:hypothetical protein